MIIKFIFLALNISSFRCVFVQREDFFERVYGRDLLRAISSRAEVMGGLIDPGDLSAHGGRLRMAEGVFTGWGAPKIAELLPLCDNLKVIFFAGGTASDLISQEVWDRGIRITSSYVANAVPVAEYSLAAILLGLKGGWRAMMEVKMSHRYIRRTEVAGAYGTTVGLIACGAIARELLRLLRAFDLKALVYDPFLSAEEIRSLGAEPAGLDEIFLKSDVISLHSPELEETIGMIRGRHLASMRPGATFINTARGAVVNERELYDVAAQRPDLQFVLDVLDPEPPAECSPVFLLPNIIVTPHIAGAMGGECLRMGQYMLEELERYLSGKPLRWSITPTLAARSIHRPEFMRNLAPLAAV